MSRPISPAEVEAELWRLSKKLEQATDDLAAKAVRAAEAEVNYKAAFAKSVLAAEAKTVSDREAIATLETQELLRERRVAEALQDSTLELCRTLRGQLSALQSLSANMRGQV